LPYEPPKRMEAHCEHSLQARLDRLEQAIQPGGWFFAIRADPTQELVDQIAT
jgi:hypothetical protein